MKPYELTDYELAEASGFLDLTPKMRDLISDVAHEGQKKLLEYINTWVEEIYPIEQWQSLLKDFGL